MLVKAMSKLYLSGEYAVLKKGSYAIIAAIDKYTYLDITESDEELIISNIQDKNNLIKNSILSAFEYLGYYRTMKYEYMTELYDNDKKYGLGSSASVVVVTIKAILQYFNVEYTKDKLFELSVKSLKKSGLSGSMGDVACICYEDLILYKSINDNFEYSIKKIKLKKELLISAYWTGIEASTKKQISNIHLIQDSENFLKFNEISNDNTMLMLEALENGDEKLLIKSITNLRNNLLFLQDFSGIEIYNEKINSMIKNDNFKTSGAGKGDFVISLNLGEKNEKGSTYKVCFRM